jgi:RNA polymerase sigma factor (sigma-70 family)
VLVADDTLERMPARSEFPAEERSALFDALQELPPMQRRTVVLRHWLGLSIEETAAELGIGIGTVKSNSSRGVAALRGLLAEQQA